MATKADLEARIQELEATGAAAVPSTASSNTGNCDCVACRKQRGLDPRVNEPSGLITDRLPSASATATPEAAAATVDAEPEPAAAADDTASPSRWPRRGS